MRSNPGEGVGVRSLWYIRRNKIIRELYAEGMTLEHLMKVFGRSYSSILHICHEVHPPRRDVQRNVDFPTPDVEPGCGYSVIVERSRGTLAEYRMISTLFPG